MNIILAIALAAVAAGSPLSFGSELQQCDAAPNCERYIRDDNSTGIRFVEGMGPDSDWYRDNVRKIDPFAPANINNPVLRRQDSATTFNPEMLPQRTIFGSANPVDVVNSLYEGCAQSNCMNGPFYYTARYVNNLGTLIASGTGQSVGDERMKLTTSGWWDGADPNHRTYYIESLRQIMASDIRSENVVWTNANQGVLVRGEVETWTGAEFISMSRFIGGVFQGGITVKIEVVQSDPGSCSTIFGLLGTAAGVISGIGGGFFGALGEAVCR